LSLSAEWEARGIGLRLRQSEDLAFLRDLYHTTRAEEVAAAGLDALSAALFLSGQFDLQCRHFDAHHMLGGQRLVVLAGDRPIGRIDLWRTEAAGRPDLRLVDISLLPEWRGQGLGAGLLGAVQRAAADGGRSVSLHVDKMSRAIHLYRRLGFRKMADTGASWRMEWRAGGASRARS
jgi:ribosomal protein S18 acetylase RimI-like enzyme